MAPNAASLTGLLGLGFWVQGFRSFAAVNVTLYLQRLKISPASIQLIETSANLPMVAKPIYGVVSDGLSLRQERRLPYIAIGVVLQAASWILLSLFPPSFMSFLTLSLLLLLENSGEAIVEVVNTAIVTEAGKNVQENLRGHLESLVWMCRSFGSIIGFLLAGAVADKMSPRITFFIFALVLGLQFLITTTIHENSLGISQNGGPSSMSSRPLHASRHLPRGQFISSTDNLNHALGPPRVRRHRSRWESLQSRLSELTFAFQRKDILYGVLSFAASSAIIPNLSGTMHYYHTYYLDIGTGAYSVSKVFTQGYILFWSIAYNRWLMPVNPDRIMSVLQGTLALFMLSDVLFVEGLYRLFGISDRTYVIIFSSFLEALYTFPLLPFMVLMTNRCPQGCEGSLMALVMSAAALAGIVSEYFGGALAAVMGISGENFSGLVVAILVQAGLTVFPLYWP